MRLLICGSRDWTDEDMISTNSIYSLVPGKDVVIHGAAPGADRRAGRLAKVRGIEVLPFPADWKRYGNSAGPIRNQRMIDDGYPDVVHAYKDGFDLNKVKGVGTEDMVRRAIAANIPWKLFTHDRL